MLWKNFFIITSVLPMPVCRARLLGRERVEKSDLESRNGKHMCFVLLCL